MKLIKATTMMLGLVLSGLATPGALLSSEMEQLEPHVVSDQLLAIQRGGLFNHNGLEIRFNLEQLSAVNGDPVGYRQMRYGDSGGLMLRTDRHGSIIEHVSGTGWANVLQNQQSDQVLSHFTVLGIDLEGIGMASQAVNQRVIDSGLIGSLRSP